MVMAWVVRKIRPRAPSIANASLGGWRIPAAQIVRNSRPSTATGWLGRANVMVTRFEPQRSWEASDAD